MANVPLTDLSALPSTDVATGDTLYIVDVSEALPADQSKQITLGNLFEWQSYTPTFTGFSSDPTVTAKYLRIGNLCIVNIFTTAAGTSNATGFTISAPVTCTVSTRAAIALHTDSGTAATGGRVSILATQTTFTLGTSAGTAGWTSSGDKSADFQIIYEV